MDERYLIFGLINLAIVLGLVVYFFRKPISKFFLKRSSELEKRRQYALVSLKQARANFDEFRLKIGNIAVDMKNLLDSAEKEGEVMGREMLFQAENVTDHIIEQSMIRADQLIAKKNREIYHDLVEKSLKVAEERIVGRLDLEEQIRLCRAYLKELVKTEVERSVR